MGEIGMQKFTVLALALSAAILSPASLQTACAETLKVGGTGAATELMRELGRAYAKQASQELEVVPSLGSSGAIGALADGALDFAVSARPLKADEAAKGMRVPLTVRTPFVLATSHPKPPVVKSTDVPAAYLSEKATWTDGLPLRVILRPKSESDAALIEKLFPGTATAVTAARLRSDVPVAATDQDNADFGERIPGSLIGTSYTQVLLEKRNLRFVAIDGVEPTMGAFEAGAYKYDKTIYLVISDKATKRVDQFIDWLKSPAGDKQLRTLHVLRGN
jgi:phosphate transport system substrate-binding protein